MPTLWWGARPREMKALATVTTSAWYWWYVQLLHSPSLLTVSATLCGARATVSSNMDHTDLAGLLDQGSLPKLSRILTGSSGLIVVNCKDQDHKESVSLVGTFLISLQYSVWSTAKGSPDWM